MPKLKLALLRGINVGGKNKVPMADLRSCLEDLGYENVQTYIASGNVLFDSTEAASTLRKEIETALPKAFKLDSELVKALVLSRDQLAKVIDSAPKGFGAKPDEFHSDAVFLIGISPTEAMKVFDPREGVDKVWKGKGVIYSQRLSAERTKSRMGKIAGTPAYKEMTIRGWKTTTKLLELMNERQ